jgi:hypothetical protein
MIKFKNGHLLFTPSGHLATTCGTKIDVLFLMDTTGSMGDVIAGGGNAFIQIMSALRATFGSGLRFALAGYKDCDPTDPPLMIHAFTADASVVEGAIRGLAAEGGFLDEEGQFKAFVLLSQNWLATSGVMAFAGRPDAHKIVIWCGDYYGWRNADYNFTTAIAALNAQVITVYALNCKVANDGIDYITYNCDERPPVYRPQAQTICSATGGLVFSQGSCRGSSWPGAAQAIVSDILSSL